MSIIVIAHDSQILHAPCDIEGHLGKDGRLYLLDFARVFPPESPPSVSPPRGCHLYRLLRGELVKQAATPLSSDAFSGFGRNNFVADKAVRVATMELYRTAVPRFAASFQRDHLLLAHPLQAMESLSSAMHRVGLNCRFLGRVRHDCSEAAARSVLLGEMLARTVKRLLWKLFRETQEAQALPSEEPYVARCVETLNHLLQEYSPDIWFNLKNQIIDYFGRMSLEPWELSADYDLRRHCKISILVREGKKRKIFVVFFFEQIALKIRRVCSLSGIVLSEEALAALDEGVIDRFVAADVVSLLPRVKSMNVVELSSAISLSMQAASARTQEQQERLFLLAYKKFEGASAASPSNLTTSKYWSLALLAHARLAAASDRAGRACVLLQEADARFAQMGVVSETVLEHAACVRLLATLSAEPLHAASLFVRAVSLGMAADNPEEGLKSAEDTCVAAREYAGHFTGQQAYGVLCRVRDSLLDVRLKKQHNAFSMLLMDLSDVGLDVTACRTVCAQLVKDRDLASLCHLVASCVAKFELLPSRPLMLGKAVLELIEEALSCFPLDATLRSAWSKSSLLVAASQPLEMDDELARRVLEAASLAEVVKVSEVLAILDGFFKATLFVENITYQTRSSLPLEQFAALSEQAVWDAATSSWLPSLAMEAQLRVSLQRVAQLCCALLELVDDRDENLNLLQQLSLSRLCALFGYADPSERQCRRLACSGTLVLQRAFGVDERSVERMARSVRIVSLSVARGAASLLSSASVHLRLLTRLDLSQAVVIERFPSECAPCLQELLLPPRCTLVDPPALPALSRLQLAWKPNADGLYHLLVQAPSIVVLELPNREGRLVSVHSRGNIKDAATSLRWCRAVCKQLLLHPQQMRDATKLLYRAVLPHDPLALSVLSEHVFVNGSLNGAMLNLIRKLGTDLLLGAARKLSNDQLFDVLTHLDKLDSYDASSALSALISSIARLLFSSDAQFFSRTLQICRPARLPSLLASLPADLAMQLAVKQNPEAASMLLGALLASTQQPNAIELQVQHALFLRLYLQEAQFAKQMEARLIDQFSSLQVSTPRECRELLLGLQCNVPISLDWSSLASCHLVDAPGLTRDLLVSVFKLLPKHLSSFALRYRDHVRQPIPAVDDGALLLLTSSRETLASVILDLTPALTNVGLRAFRHCGDTLKTLQLRSPLLSDEGVEELMLHCPNLTNLRLQASLRDICLSKLGSHGNLETLELFECPLVTYHGLERLLMNSGTSLSTLRLQDCRHCTPGDLWMQNKFLKLLSRGAKPGDYSCTKTSFEYK